MAKESTPRAEELKALGWSNDDVSRYAELWDYRQRWGAINLEREDRLFLRKAEAALPKIITSKSAPKKALQEKSYYRWLKFYLDSMNKAEIDFNLKKGERGVWPILIEEELRALDYYEPVLGLPDTIKAKGLDSVREEIVKNISAVNANIANEKNFDFHAPINDLKASEGSKWRFLREGVQLEDHSYPILSLNSLESIRKDVRAQLVVAVRDLLPSLADTQKPEPPDDWSRIESE